MSTMEQEIAEIKSELKSIARMCRRIRAHQEDPDGTKKAERSKNNGFNRPQKISEKLAAFLGTGDEMISRSEVTKRVTAYIREKGLKHPDNGRIILMDDALRNLLQPPADLELTFLNIQKYLTPHYVKK